MPHCETLAPPDVVVKLCQGAGGVADSCTKLTVLFSKPPSPSAAECGVICNKVEQSLLQLVSTLYQLSQDQGMLSCLRVGVGGGGEGYTCCVGSVVLRCCVINAILSAQAEHCRRRLKILSSGSLEVWRTSYLQSSTRDAVGKKLSCVLLHPLILPMDTWT